MTHVDFIHSLISRAIPTPLTSRWWARMPELAFATNAVLGNASPFGPQSIIFSAHYSVAICPSALIALRTMGCLFGCYIRILAGRVVFLDVVRGYVRRASHWGWAHS